MTVRVTTLGVGIFGLFAIAYTWASPSLALQHWDSLDYAHACEEQGVSGMWGNHPLGHAVQCGVVKVSRRLGFQGRALPAMKLFNGVTAAAAVAALFGVMTTMLGTGLLRAASWAVVFGSTYGVWHYAGTADIYSLSMLLLIVGFGLTVWSFDRPSPRRCLMAGVAVGAATLSHQFSGVVLLAGTIGLLPLLSGLGWRRLVAALGSFVMAAAMAILGGYVLLGIRATGSSSPAKLLWWVVGHGHDPTYGHFFSLGGASLALRSAATTLLRGAGRWPSHARLVGAVMAGVGLSVASVVWIRRLPGRFTAISLSCGLQCVVGWLLVVWWEPHALGKFWLLTLPPFLMWCELALAGLRHRALQSRNGPRSRWTRPLDAAPLLAGILLFLTTSDVMLRERQSDESFERSLNAWVAHSGSGDVLIESGRFTPHLLFWGQRPGTVNLYRIIQASEHESDRFVKVREVMHQAWRQNRAVLFSPGLTPYYSDDRLAVVGVTRQQILDFFNQYEREGPLFEYQEADGGDARPVYRLVEHAK